MSADEDRSEPDVAKLFAPVAVEDTFAGVLVEARDALGHLDDPVDAELWGSDLIGALAASSVGQASLMDALTGALVPAAEAASSPEALALLRIGQARSKERGIAQRGVRTDAAARRHQMHRVTQDRDVAGRPCFDRNRCAHVPRRSGAGHRRRFRL